MRDQFHLSLIFSSILFLVGWPNPATSEQQTLTEEQYAEAIKQGGLLQITGVLDGQAEEDSRAFVQQLAQAVTQMMAYANENPFEDEQAKTRLLAIKFYKSCLISNFEAIDIPKEKAFGLGWGMLIMCNALHEDVLTEGLLQAIDEVDDPFILSTDRRKLAAITYGIDGTGHDPHFESFLSELRKTEGEHREKAIAFFISYEPVTTFRLILEQKKKTLDNVPALSWFDRRWQELLWAEQNRVPLDEAFVKQLAEDFEALRKHEAWWVRLYAAELLAERPTLAEKGTLKAMTDDPNRLVRMRVRGLLKNVD